LYLVFCILLLYKLFHPDFFSFSRGKQLMLLGLVFYFSVFVICLSSRIMTIGFLSLLALGTFHFAKDQSRLRRFSISFTAVAFFIFLVYINPVSRYRFFQEMALNSRITLVVRVKLTSRRQPGMGSRDRRR
jgi:hypothetical protein